MEMPQGGANGEAPGGLESPLSPPLSPATAAAAALANARWNPTKEQVTMLEGLYEHGLRTPSAEQIQHITSRLREHGPIEAKNVFYWFQNHKARQRQKQRQDSFAYFNRMMRRAPPLPVIARPPGPSFPPMMTMAPPPPAACNNGGGGTHGLYRTPYYMPAPPPQASAANAAGYYSVQQAAHHMAAMYPRMEIAAHDKHMNPASMHQQPAPYGTSNPLHLPPANGTSNPLHVPPANGGVEAGGHVSRSRQTLELFPLRPTFLLPDTARDFSILSSASASFSGGESESLAESPNSSAEALPFYDFFGLQSADR